MNENGTVVQYGADEEDYITDVFTAKAVDFINRAEENDQQPFFLTFTPTAPHADGARNGPATPATAPADLMLLEVLASSSEPDNAEGDGNTTGDDGFAAPVDVTNFFTFNPETNTFEGVVSLRAERAGRGDGRTYTIETTVMNADLNRATSHCTVVVPHDDE